MSEEALLQIYYFMCLTRAMEDRTRTLFLQGKIVGGVYTAQGHEAATVGAVSMLSDGDCIVPQHRDLGMHLVRGTSPRAVMSQWLARGTSPSLGRDNALHIGDMHHGVVPSISMLGESLPVACGVALTMKMRKRSTIVLAPCGDGATNTVADRALAYGMPGESVDGNDVLAVIEAVTRAVQHVRSGKGPSLVECKTFRVRGHSEADKADYVPPALREEWLARDPIKRFEEYLTKKHILTAAGKAEIEAKVKAAVDDAVDFAEHSPVPDAETVADYVYAPDGPIAIIGEPGALDPRYVNALDQRTGQPFNTMSKKEEVVGRR